MTSNDRQIDLLMRRYAKAAPRLTVSDHLDADELSAFAEGALPQATRVLYVSHLAECDECRKQASDLAISSGAMVSVEQSQPKTSEGRSFWQVLAGMFALPVLRYAAFGAVVLIVAGVAFVALRRSPESPLIALNEPMNQKRETAVKPSVGVQDGREKQTNTATTGASPSQSPSDRFVNSKTDEARAPESLPAQPAPLKDGAVPVIAEKKAGDVDSSKTAPSYAPPPPNDAVNMSKQQQNVARDLPYSGVSGPRQQQQKVESMDKLAVLERERDANKEVARSDDARKMTPGSVAAAQPMSSRRASDEKAKGPMRNMDNSAMNRNDSSGRAESPKKSGEDRATTEEAQTRSVGGRKFRRQGNAWVDQKFKSSMTLKSIARGSNEFADLDSGLRSIAQQLGGEVIIVWKDKAYLIK
jgi:putative zinc finger protein